MNKLKKNNYIVIKLFLQVWYCHHWFFFMVVVIVAQCVAVPMVLRSQMSHGHGDFIAFIFKYTYTATRIIINRLSIKCTNENNHISTTVQRQK